MAFVVAGQHSTALKVAMEVDSSMVGLFRAGIVYAGTSLRENASAQIVDSGQSYTPHDVQC